jgi:hypothetical protein
MRTYRNQILAATGVAALALAVPFSIAQAQVAADDSTAPSQQGGQFGGPPPLGGQFGGPGAPSAGPGGLPQQPGQLRGAGALGGGAVSMALDNTHLYIVRGNQIYKVSKSDLRVNGVGELPQPTPGGNAAGGRGTGRAGGGE